MDVFKRYIISFSIASVFLIFIAIYAEKYFEGQIPHNLTNEKSDNLRVNIPNKKVYEKCFNLNQKKNS